MCSLTSSENMVKLYGVVIEPRICMILEYCGGGSLYSILNTEDFDFELDQFFLWIKQIVEGIKYLHKNSIVHRDLKSLNLLLTDDLHIKVADFGLSRFFTQNSHLSTLQKLRGTYCYTAPEIYFHQTYTTKSDFYSLGIIIWEMSMRYFFKKYFRPYSEYTYLTMDCQIIIKCAKEELRPTIPEKFPKRLRGFIKYLWAQSPDFRPNGEQLSTALNELEKSTTFPQAQISSEATCLLKYFALRQGVRYPN
uniref:Protein kinase domain-containing protein n=1 Tax=Arcella intermedia TaxID=1963864 RepID=A0A6B2LBQ2_9EUKA